MIKRPPIAIEQRRPFKINQKRKIALRQSDEAGRVFCSCGCSAHIANLGTTKTGLIKIEAVAPFAWEHDKARALGGKTTIANGRMMAKACHDGGKTPLDVARITKAKRQAMETGQQARRAAGKTMKIRSRGFDKTRSRNFKGEVVART
jgi:hypothetical protein